MEIVGGRKFIEVPGEKTHELPPLLVRSNPKMRRLDKVVGMANDIIDDEDMIQLPAVEADDHEMDRRKMDLAINLVNQYLQFVAQWQWGDSIIEWIRQCEISFGTRLELRNLLRTDVWPHAGRASFVTLLSDKAVAREEVVLDRAVGLRLTFRQPPPISCFSNQFLFYLNSSVATTAYQTWAHMSPDPVCSLPPERFAFQVIHMS